jgi:hypothetical protein
MVLAMHAGSMAQVLQQATVMHRGKPQAAAARAAAAAGRTAEDSASRDARQCAALMLAARSIAAAGNAFAAMPPPESAVQHTSVYDNGPDVRTAYEVEQ